MTLKTNTILNGDCIEHIKQIPENSVDAIITDPPYGIGFMGKNWDTFKEGEKARKRDEEKDKKKVVKKELYDASTGKMKKVRWVVPTGGRVAGTYDRSQKGLIGFQIWMQEVAIECLRILKPGGFLLVFGGTRTYHRLVCGIEDAGFEIRDTIMWLYGSGFPKSLNIGKQIDKRKKQGDPLKFGELCKKKREGLGISVGKADKIINGGSGNYRIWIEGTHHKDHEPQRLPRWEEYLKIKELYKLDDFWDECMQEAEREVIGEKIYPNGIGRNDKNFDKWDITNFTLQTKPSEKRLETAPATPEAKQWEGWGTALKPAVEPIVVARKPLSEKNVALNVLKWGTGGINIDECRIGTETRLNKRQPIYHGNTGTFSGQSEIPTRIDKEVQGRFPSNVILNEEAGKMLDEQSGILGSDSLAVRKTANTGGTGNVYTTTNDNVGNVVSIKGKGGASRFFYCAKASKSERNFGLENTDIPEKPIPINEPHNSKSLEERYKMVSRNNHPTVKPIALMEYLIKLVSKEGAIILDPFLGSGTTAIACLKLNRLFIGIEKEEEYVKIANARIKPYLEQTKL